MKNRIKATVAFLIALMGCASDPSDMSIVGADASANLHSDTFAANDTAKQDVEAAVKPECLSKVECNDGNVCTFDLCEKGMCENVGINDEAYCGDGNPCVSKQFCFGMQCVTSAEKPCDDDNACTADTCDKNTGACSHTPTEGVKGCIVCKEDADCGEGGYNHYCAEGLAYTEKLAGCVSGLCKWYIGEGELCKLGCNDGTGMCKECVAGGCDDGDICTIDSCDVNGKCAYSPASCDDNNLCTLESCNPLADGCEWKAVNCNDSNPCTNDSCSPVSGCVHDFIPACQICQADAECNDNNWKTKDSCDAGQCNHGKLFDCSPGETCFSGTCTPNPNGNEYTTECNDGNPATMDLCPMNGQCKHMWTAFAVSLCVSDEDCTFDGVKGPAVCGFTGPGGVPSIEIRNYCYKGPGKDIGVCGFDPSKSKDGNPKVMCPGGCTSTVNEVGWMTTCFQK